MKISGTYGLGGVLPTTGERGAIQPAASPASTKLDDRLTLSSTARLREAASTHPRFGALSVAAHADPELAEQLAYDYAHIVHDPVIDMTDEVAGTGPAKYAATGEPWTPELDAKYRERALTLQSQSLAVYEEETAKGTDPADIFDKLIALGDAQPNELRDLVDWEGKLE